MLNTLNIENFTCFPKAELTFSKGLNVIVGENGTGKSHLLKLGYTVLQCVAEQKQGTRGFNGFGAEPPHDIHGSRDLCFDFLLSLNPIFNLSTPLSLINKSNYKKGTKIKTTFSNSGIIDVFFEEATSTNPNVVMKDCTNINTLNSLYEELVVDPVFFPAKEIMSIYNGFRSTLKKRELGFDKTYEYFAESLDVPLLKHVENKSIENNIYLLEKAIKDYTVEYDSKVFYFRKKFENKTQASNEIIPATLFAEGHNKLGTLSYLMRNGTIQEGMTLFWDEPEANMNPKLLKILAEVLAEMSSHVQVILSTHSLFLLRELEILQEQKKVKNSRYFGLQLNTDETGIEILQGDTSDDIGDIAALDESLAQSQRFREVTYEQ